MIEIQDLDIIIKLQLSKYRKDSTASRDVHRYLAMARHSLQGLKVKNDLVLRGAHTACRLQHKAEFAHLTCIDKAILVSADIDGLDIWQLEVPLQVWKDEGGNKACKHKEVKVRTPNSSPTDGASM